MCLDSRARCAFPTSFDARPPLSSADASYSRGSGLHARGKNARRLGRGKIKARGEQPLRRRELGLKAATCEVTQNYRHSLLLHLR